MERELGGRAGLKIEGQSHDLKEGARKLIEAMGKPAEREWLLSEEAKCTSLVQEGLAASPAEASESDPKTPQSADASDPSKETAAALVVKGRLLTRDSSILNAYKRMLIHKLADRFRLRRVTFKGAGGGGRAAHGGEPAATAIIRLVFSPGESKLPPETLEELEAAVGYVPPVAPRRRRDSEDDADPPEGEGRGTVDPRGGMRPAWDDDDASVSTSSRRGSRRRRRRGRGPSGPRDSHPSHYDSHPGHYDSHPSHYDSHPSHYDSHPSHYDSHPGHYDSHPGHYDSHPSHYGRNPYGAAAPGPYGFVAPPYGYVPPHAPGMRVQPSAPGGGPGMYGADVHGQPGHPTHAAFGRSPVGHAEAGAFADAGASPGHGGAGYGTGHHSDPMYGGHYSDQPGGGYGGGYGGAALAGEAGVGYGHPGFADMSPAGLWGAAAGLPHARPEAQPFAGHGAAGRPGGAWAGDAHLAALPGGGGSARASPGPPPPPAAWALPASRGAPAVSAPVSGGPYPTAAGHDPRARGFAAAASGDAAAARDHTPRPPAHGSAQPSAPLGPPGAEWVLMQGGQWALATPIATADNVYAAAEAAARSAAEAAAEAAARSAAATSRPPLHVSGTAAREPRAALADSARSADTMASGRGLRYAAARGHLRTTLSAPDVWSHTPSSLGPDGRSRHSRSHQALVQSPTGPAEGGGGGFAAEDDAASRSASMDPVSEETGSASGGRVSALPDVQEEEDSHGEPVAAWAMDGPDGEAGVARLLDE